MSELADGRDALAYWERRARSLPRHAVRGRREARRLAARWSDRVAAQEAAEYGRGLPGALWLLASEGRVPEPARRAGRTALRRGTQALAVAGVACVAVLVASVAVLVSLVGALV